MNNIEGYLELEKKIAYVFNDKQLVKQALSHSSYANETKINKNDDYERLEFLGDAVLELTVSEYLFANKHSMREGDMTKLRASLVCEPTLAALAREQLSLGDYILLGKGEENTGGRNRDSIVSDVFEAVIGAIYLDGGFEKAKEFIDRYVIEDMDNKIEFSDSKTNLQEYAQEKGYSLEYKLIEEKGPAHEKIYTMAVCINGEIKARAEGKTKKTAEQKAAFEVLKAVKANNGDN